MKLNETKNPIIVPWDFSEMSLEALHSVVDMVTDPSCIRVLHVTQMPTAYEYGVVWETFSEQKIHKNIVQAFRDKTKEFENLKDLDFTCLFGHPGQQICQFAKDLEAELIVMPSHGHSGLTRMFLGSVADRVIRGATCPVLILRTQKTGQTESETVAPSAANLAF